MNESKAWLIGIITITVAVLLLLMTVVISSDHKDAVKFKAAVEAGLEQQQREGSVRWLWAYPKEDN